MDITDMKLLVESCTYKPGWTIDFHFGEKVFSGHRRIGFGTVETFTYPRPWLQLFIDATTEASLDSAKRDGSRTPWKSGKRYLSPHMCRQEVVGAVFGLIKDAEMHEIHEWFRYKGASIFNPHLDPDVLASVAGKAASFNVREDAMMMMVET